jgi:hypothetical protein
MRGRWQETQQLIAEWKAAAERPKKPRRRSGRNARISQSEDMELPF